MRLITNLKFSREEFEARLRFKTNPVGQITPHLQHLALDLLEMMYNINAIGLAANQVSLSMQLCVLDPAFLYNKKMPIVMFNPCIIEHGEELYDSMEGCLSLPEFGLPIPRFRKIVVKYIGMDGLEHIIKDDNSLLSSCLQHEIDHLNGILMLDRLTEKKEIPFNKGD